nr:response regulator [Actinomycetota bacterium]
MPSQTLILVADDDDDIRLLVSLRLQRAGYQVITAEDGRAAIQAAIDHSPDLMILDVSMPGLGGHAVCREI